MDAKSGWTLLQEKIAACERCPRLRAHCRAVAEAPRAAYRGFSYWGKPVPNLGGPGARLLLVGLAPGAHGANRTGRMFTGDRSGDFLFRALHEAGLANQPESLRRGDGLRLLGCAITAAAHCAPPDNRPTTEELALCAGHLEETVRLLPRLRAVLALGGIAFDACLRLYRSRGWLGAGGRPRFTHGAVHRAGTGPPLFASYHPSQQNTFTGRLTMPMLVEVLESASCAARPRGGR